jgi:deoxyadenosine/deoxycytidine kinase
MQVQQKKFLAVAGNIGCGKTTLTNRISNSFGWVPMFESVEDNPYLIDFYGDMSRYSFPLQIYFLNHRFKAHKSIEMGNFSAVQDRTIYEDANIFARNLFEIGKMTQRDYQTYLDVYQTIISHLAAPDLMIFLKRSVPKLAERINGRGRDCEKNIDLDYLERLNFLYQDWFSKYNLGPSLLIDTDELDFAQSPEDYSWLIRQIANSFDQQDFLISQSVLLA